MCIEHTLEHTHRTPRFSSFIKGFKVVLKAASHVNMQYCVLALHHCIIHIKQGFLIDIVI